MSTTSSVTTSATTGTNINVASIVSQLMAVEQQPLTALTNKQTGIQAQISAYGSVQSALSSFQSSMSGLSNVTALQSLTATPSDSSVMTASAATIATPGTYNINVTSLAQSEQLVAAGQLSQTTSIGTGAATTLTFDFGTITGTAAAGQYPTGTTFASNGSGSKVITIDATNNSLQGLRDAINSANVGVTASIINDGSANPYRLALSSNAQGASNSIKISVAGDSALSSLLAQDPASSTGQALNETTTALNAAFTVNGVSVTKPSNAIIDVIHGVTLNLLKVSTTPQILNIARDTSSVSTAATNFVKAYNDLHTAINSVVAYDTTNKTAAILQGDFAVNAIANQLRHVMNVPVSGAGALATLPDIGITFQKDGSMALDSTKLNAAVANHFSDIATLFGTVGKATDSLISYDSAPSTVKPGSYGVEITQLASQGMLVGSAAAGTTTITAGSNDTLGFTVDGISSTVTLDAGSYSADTLATAVQAKINGASSLASSGSSVRVTQRGGIFSIISNKFGAASGVAISGNGASNLLGDAPVATAGLDVAGSIGGLLATGSGQFLTSSGGDSLGIKILVSGGAVGTRGTVNYSQGYAYSLNQYATAQLNSNGLIKIATDGLNTDIANIGKQQTRISSRLAALQASYTAQFTALDGLLSSMNSTSTYLTQQLAALTKA
jgi:flagellar hook-associated protein 2